MHGSFSLYVTSCLLFSKSILLLIQPTNAHVSNVSIKILITEEDENCTFLITKFKNKLKEAAYSFCFWQLSILGQLLANERLAVLKVSVHNL